MDDSFVCCFVHYSDVYSPSEIVLIMACVQTHTSFIIVCVTWLCLPLGLELMLKLRPLLTVFIFTLKAEARDDGKGALHFQRGLWCLTNHNAPCQLANQSRLRLSEGGTLILNIKSCLHILLHQIHQIMIFKKKASYEPFKLRILPCRWYNTQKAKMDHIIIVSKYPGVL